MGAIDPTGAFDQRTCQYAGATEFLDADAEADDVDDRIKRADFVEGDLLRRNAVDLAFDHRDALENGEGALFDEIREGAVGDQFANLLVIAAMGVLMLMTVCVALLVDELAAIAGFLLVIMVMRMPVRVFMLMGMRVLLMLMFVAVAMIMPAIMGMFMIVTAAGVLRFVVHCEFDAGHILALIAIGVEMKLVRQLEFAEFPLDGGEFHTEVDQRADEHVAAGPGEAIEVERFHKVKISFSRRVD